jgi:hypothetical protein
MSERLIQRRAYLKRNKPLARGKVPLRRSAAPKRKTWLKRRRATPRKTKTLVRDEAYKAAVRKLPCCGLPDGTHAPDCRPWMRRQASHIGTDGGKGIKAGDLRCVAQTGPCHRYMETSGKFTKPQRRAWSDVAVADAHAEIERRGLYRFPAVAGESSYPTAEAAPVKLSRGEPSPAAASDASGQGSVPW